MACERCIGAHLSDLTACVDPGDFDDYCTAAANAAAAPPPCSLNGALVGGTCQCYGPWTGKDCGVLSRSPLPDGHVPAYGFAPNVTSWGGNIVLHDDGLYHLFVSEIPGGLSHWTHSSQIVHAVAKDPLDAFHKVEVTLPAQAHNAAPLRAPATHAACPRCIYLWHIGKSNSSSGFAHRSTSPFGPWTPLPQPFGCNNPAPAFAANGTLFLVCNSKTIVRCDGDPASATAKWPRVAELDEAPWTAAAPRYLRVEDAYLWQDPRANWHLFVHRYDYRDGYPANPNETRPVLVSAHAYSPDLLEWTLSPEPPYPSELHFASGRVQHLSTMERPHLLMGADGEPAYLVNGVSPVWDQWGPPCNVCDARPGSQHSCVVCKTSKGVDWTYTVVQRLESIL